MESFLARYNTTKHVQTTKVHAAQGAWRRVPGFSEPDNPVVPLKVARARGAGLRSASTRTGGAHPAAPEWCSAFVRGVTAIVM